jgi:hypothetical protein
MLIGLFGLGLFRFGLGLYGFGFRSSVFMPTPKYTNRTHERTVTAGRAPWTQG